MESSNNHLQDSTEMESSSFTTDPKMLTQLLLPILNKLFRMEESVPFKSPFEAASINMDLTIPPMDLSDIEARLNLNLYVDPWQFVDDVWLLFEDAWCYNRETSKVYKCCSKLAEVFEDEINKCMQSLGYCCGRRYVFSPGILECYGKKLCSIPKNANYYKYKNEYSYCSTCFHAKTNSGLISKKQFTEFKNNLIEPELFLECERCKRKLHKICVLYVEQLENEKFICTTCEPNFKDRRKKLFQDYSAKKLPTTKLSQYLQSRVTNFLNAKHVETGGLISIRVVSSWSRFTCVKSEMKKRLTDNGLFAERFPYTAKTIFAFQEVDGIDISIFAMHVQEYGSSCPEPNSRRVYISYLDSVNLFRPKHLRTNFYYEILLGYIDYVKQLGYKAVHVWACPPPDEDDYLFYRHPPDQRSPDHDRLEAWYTTLLYKGIEEGIILQNLDILQTSTSEGQSLISRIPYFENDFWPNVLEDSLKELGSENENSYNRGVSDSVGLEQFLIEKLHTIHNKQKEVFFVFQLHSFEIVSSLPPIIDPDPSIRCEFMNNRDHFLLMCREKNYEFSSFRRAKYSSLVLLFELHTNNYEKAITYTCNLCTENITSGYHCTMCDDFDLCVMCWNKENHEHNMDYRLFTSESTNAEHISEDKANTKRDSETLTHARLCKDNNCKLVICSRIKSLISHFTTCPNTVKSKCPLCKQLLAMCWHHAKYCQMKNCPVPTCDRIKEKLAR